MQRFYSHGKLLLTAEYFVLDGAKALALPTKKGQHLQLQKSAHKGLLWKSWDVDNHCWFEALFKLPKLTTKNTSKTANTLQKILKEAQRLNPNFLATESSLLAETFLEFPNNWGLGTSSTLINNNAQWADVNPYELLQNSFGGSGYDIAVAQKGSPIVYQIENQIPKSESIRLDWNFTDQLFFVHLNKKQDSKEGIAHYKMQNSSAKTISAINNITASLQDCTTIEDFENAIEMHETLVSETINLPTVKAQYFKDYPRSMKSLGAWGGDFILVTGDATNFAYFKNQGFHTILPFSEMIA